MRDILFRGKRIDDNTWAFGGIVHQTDLYGDIVDKYFIIDGTETQDYDIGYEFEVYPETIGQCTGLTDKNGIKIFEGDILSYNNDNYIKMYGNPIVYIGEYKDTDVYNEDEEEPYYEAFGVFIQTKVGDTGMAQKHMNRFEVIGNIYDDL